MLIPIGAWCRTAYQVNRFLERHGTPKISFPFDWTITPFSALQHTFNSEFTPEKLLVDSNLKINKVGSIQDQQSLIIFHHDLPKHLVKRHEHTDKNQNGVPFGLINSDELRSARQRFNHTYKNLISAIEKASKNSERIGFIRWIRLGHPDVQFPDAFCGENIQSLWSTLSEFTKNDKIVVLQIQTQRVNVSDIAEESRIVSYHSTSIGASAIIKERPGFNGDMTNNFKGDTKSWDMLLSRFVDEFKVNL